MKILTTRQDFSYMLERSSRITSRKDFNRIFKSAKNISTPTCILKVRKSPTARTRFAFVVSTKVSKLAVERNQLKRRLRAIIRELKPNIVPGFEVIIIAKPTMKTQGYAQLLGTMREICQKAGILLTK